MDAATQLPDGNLMLVKDRKYWIFDAVTKRFNACGEDLVKFNKDATQTIKHQTVSRLRNVTLEFVKVNVLFTMYNRKLSSHFVQQNVT